MQVKVVFLVGRLVAASLLSRLSALLGVGANGRPVFVTFVNQGLQHLGGRRAPGLSLCMYARCSFCYFSSSSPSPLPRSSCTPPNSWLGDVWERVRAHKMARAGPPEWRGVGGRVYVEELLCVLARVPISVDMLRETVRWGAGLCSLSTVSELALPCPSQICLLKFPEEGCQGHRDVATDLVVPHGDQRPCVLHSFESTRSAACLRRGFVDIFVGSA